jgi:pyruvate dehydrogenase E1 component alpha subunit
MFSAQLIKEGIITNSEFETMEQQIKDMVVEAEKYADESPFPDASEVLQHVFAD